MEQFNPGPVERTADKEIDMTTATDPWVAHLCAIVRAAAASGASASPAATAAPAPAVVPASSPAATTGGPAAPPPPASSPPGGGGSGGSPRMIILTVRKHGKGEVEGSVTSTGQVIAEGRNSVPLGSIVELSFTTKWAKNATILVNGDSKGKKKTLTVTMDEEKLVQVQFGWNYAFAMGASLLVGIILASSAAVSQTAESKRETAAIINAQANLEKAKKAGTESDTSRQRTCGVKKRGDLYYYKLTADCKVPVGEGQQWLFEGGASFEVEGGKGWFELVRLDCQFTPNSQKPEARPTGSNHRGCFGVNAYPGTTVTVTGAQ